MENSTAVGRDHRIDLFRGLSLWLIFIDHIPEVYLNRITPKNFGFSDAAEILVFLSGVASGMVYTPIARQSGLRIALQRAIRRGFEIYFAQLCTIALLLLTASLLAIWQPDLLHHANVAVFFADPFEAAWQAVTMRYSPVNLDPLLLMITLHFALVVVLLGILRYPAATLMASALLYVTSHLLDWYIAAYPAGQVYFNPMNWQFLYVIGVWWGAKPAHAALRYLDLKLWMLLAVGYVAFSFFIALGWQFHSLEAYVPAPIFRLIYPIDKGHMDILRLLHFFALASVIRKVLPADVPDRWQHYLRPVLWCGEHPLAVYCASVLLSFAGHAFLRMAWNNLLTQALVTLGGIVIMTGIAARLAHLNQSRGSHAPI